MLEIIPTAAISSRPEPQNVDVDPDDGSFSCTACIALVGVSVGSIATGGLLVVFDVGETKGDTVGLGVLSTGLAVISMVLVGTMVGVVVSIKN